MVPVSLLSGTTDIVHCIQFCNKISFLCPSFEAKYNNSRVQATELQDKHKMKRFSIVDLTSDSSKGMRKKNGMKFNLSLDSRRKSVADKDDAKPKMNLRDAAGKKNKFYSKY